MQTRRMKNRTCSRERERRNGKQSRVTKQINKTLRTPSDHHSSQYIKFTGGTALIHPCLSGVRPDARSPK
jgi:hypothetical protein